MSNTSQQRLTRHTADGSVDCPIVISSEGDSTTDRNRAIPRKADLLTPQGRHRSTMLPTPEQSSQPKRRLTEPPSGQPATKIQRTAPDEVPEERVDETAKITLFDATQPIIVVRTGKDLDRSFNVHEHILAASSKSFAAAVKKEWTQNLPRVIELPETEQQVFAIYSNWLYTGTLALNGSNIAATDYRQKWEHWSLLIEIHLLGEMVIDLPFQDTVIDAIEAYLQTSSFEDWRGPLPRPIKKLYDGTGTSSRCRALLAEFTADCFIPEIFRDVRDCVPADFLFDVGMLLVQRREPNRGRFRRPSDDPCYYHEHAGGVERCPLVKLSR